MHKITRFLAHILLVILVFTACPPETPGPCDNEHDMQFLSNTAATCTSGGFDTYKCSRCDFTEKRNETGIDANAHNYGVNWKRSTEHHWKECACGDKKDNAVHNFVGDVCSVCYYVEGTPPSDSCSCGKTGCECVTECDDACENNCCDEDTDPPPDPTGGILGTVNATITSTASTATITIANYTYAASPSEFTIGQNHAFYSHINNKIVTVNFTQTTATNLSLTYIHYLYWALKAHETSVTINAPENFTPVFNGRDWFTHWNGNTDIQNTHNLYASYPLGSDTLLMNNITISSVDGKRVIRYDRDLVVSQLVWQKNFDNNQSVNAPFYGFGLQKGRGNIVSGDGVLVRGGSFNDDGINEYPLVDDFSTYATALINAGLHPVDDGVLLDHSRVRISNAGDDNNVASNGMYDFILAYYNPREGGNSFEGDNKIEFLPGGTALANTHWPSNLIFDGSDNGDVTIRNIGGTDSNNPLRKGSDGVTGRPNPNFVGNLTVPMANYLRSTLGVTEFRNTNIRGDGNLWNTSSTLTNVGLIGDYGGLSSFTRDFNDEIDIEGSLPDMLGQIGNTRKGLLRVWNDVSSETVINKFRVVHVHGANGHQIRTGAPDNTIDAIELMIFHKIYNGTPNLTGTVGPNHRAFVGSDGLTRLTGPGRDFEQKHLGTNSSAPVPNPNKITENLANNYAELGEEHKWSNRATMLANTVASIAPAQQSGIKLALGPGGRIEAVLPATLGGAWKRRGIG